MLIFRRSKLQALQADKRKIVQSEHEPVTVANVKPFSCRAGTYGGLAVHLCNKIAQLSIHISLLANPYMHPELTARPIPAVGDSQSCGLLGQDRFSDLWHRGTLRATTNVLISKLATSAPPAVAANLRIAEIQAPI